MENCHQKLNMCKGIVILHLGLSAHSQNKMLSADGALASDTKRKIHLLPSVSSSGHQCWD